MAVFIDHPCKVDLDTIVDHAAWSHSDPIAALSSSRLDEKDREHFQVLFVNNEGGLILNSIINHSAAAKVMEWQPNGRILAIGWADGMVSCWVVDGKTRPMSTFSSNAQHSSEITVLKWNPAGKRLITGDKTGTLNVWIVDNRGTLTPSRQYRKRSHITAAVYCVLSPRHDPLKKMDWKKNYSPSFFFGTDRGGVIYADDLGHCTEVQQLSSSIDKMLFFEEKGRLVIITRSLLLTQYQVSEDGRVSRVMQVKMSVAKEVASVGIRSAVWAGPGLLAVATHEKMIRLLDLSSDESYNLSLSAIADIDKTDRVITVAFSPGDRYLAVGTQMGVVAIWKYCATFKKKGGEDSAVGVGLTDWELHYKTSLESSINNLYWGSNQGTVIAVTESSAVILSEAVMHTGMCGDLSVVQVSTMHVSIHLKMDDVWIENTRLLVRGLAVADSSFVVWDGKSARSCTINPQSHRSTLNEPFPTTSKAIAIADSKHLSDDALFIAENGIVKVTNYSGVQKGSITFSEAEGKPEFLHLNGKYLYVMTNNLIIKIYDVQKPTSPKALGSVMKFVDSNPDLSKGSKLKVRSICGNNTGSRLAILTSHVEGSLQVQHPDSRLHIYDRIKGSINVHDFSHESRYPASAHWDSFDSRLIAVEAVRLQLSKASSPQSSETNKEENNGSRQNDSNDNSNRKSTEVEGENEFEITLLFASSEHGILLQDSFPRQQPYGELIGINVPHVVFRNYVSPLTKGDGTPNSRNNNTVRLFAKTMRDFVGIDKVDEHTKHALLEFSFNLTLGKLDEAYRAVKAIDSPFIWENMAQMCVKTRRLDVAEVCLGNMGHARGAAALREAMKEGSAEVGLAVLAIQLGLLDDAAKLFREAERFDMLNKLYQAAGQWQKAVHLAEQKDRIHLKTTHYHYAKYLESIGDVSQAIRHYEDSETFRTEVPRMLYTTGQIEDLEEYVHTSRDVALLKWWASYLESKERYDKAKKYYTKAGDHLSLVRILCFQGDYQKAADIVEDSKSNAATYHFARQLEAQGELQEAIRYYASSGCYNHAIRLAKSYGMDSELMTFAIKSTPSLMLDCASHFEMKGDYEKAVQLYHKGGDYLHALDICFKAGQGGDGGRTKDQKQAMFDMLNTIAQDLGADSSPQTLARCAEFLVIHKQFEKAVELYIMAKRYPQAIEMCAQHRVTITETMATTLTPPTEGFDPNERKEILAALGRALKKQGSFTLASKKYTQAGDRIRAMKCLLRGGDTKAVIQFASISRNAEIYKLAANYLQQMDWREADIMKAIITFYSKAKAFEQLAGFYDSCAQVEIDEYRDYEKAYRALKESLKYLREAKGAHIDNMITALEMRLSIIERFIEARKYSKTKPNDMVDICENLLEEPQLETAIRIGDCLGLLVEHFHECGDMKRAYQYMEDMKDRRILLHPYIDAQVLEDVHEAVGVPLNDDEEAKDGSEDELDDEIEEEVEEDVDEEEPRSPRFGNRGRNSSSKFRK